MSKATDQAALSPHPIAPIVCQVLAWGATAEKTEQLFLQISNCKHAVEQAKSSCRGHWHSWDPLLSTTPILNCSPRAFVDVTGHIDKPRSAEP